MPKMENGNLI